MPLSDFAVAPRRGALGLGYGRLHESAIDPL